MGVGQVIEPLESLSISSGVRENCTSPRSGRENFIPQVTHPAERSGPGWELLARSQATHLSSPSFFTSHTGSFFLCLPSSACQELTPQDWAR